MPEKQFTAYSAAAWSADEALFGGHRSYFGEALILRLANGVITPVLERPEGYVPALATRGDRVWAVLGTPRTDGKMGSTYSLVRSDDRGKIWVSVSALPFTSVSQMLAVTDQELWLHTTRGLAMSADGGVTWDVIIAPGERNSVREQLAMADGAVALLGSPCRATRDGGETWETLDIEGDIVATDDDWWLGRHDGALSLYTPAHEWLRLPYDHADAFPHGLDVNQGRVRVLIGEPAEKQVVRLLISDDGGKSWRQDRVPGHTSDRTWALAPDGSVLVLGTAYQTVRIWGPK